MASTGCQEQIHNSLLGRNVNECLVREVCHDRCK